MLRLALRQTVRQTKTLRPVHLIPVFIVPLPLLYSPSFADTFYNSPTPPHSPPPLLLPSPPPPPSLRARIRKHLLSLLRLLEILLKLSPLAILAPLAATPYSPTPLANATWWYTTTALQSLGPAFVKFAQWAATRRDLFPTTMCDRLAVLHSRGTPHSWQHSDRILKDSLGRSYGEVVGLDEGATILGSGCVAQVYRGVRDGKPVAVKVIHPHVRSKIARDLELMKVAARVFDGLPVKGLKWFALPEAVVEFERIMEEQLDLNLEGANLRKFRKQFGWRRDVSFPEPFESTADVLVESYDDGKSISEYFDAPARVRKALARPLLLSFLRMVFTNNFIHCDLHSGNVLASQDPVDGTFRICIIDAGIVTSLKSGDATNLKDLFLAVVTNDGENAGRMIVERAKRHDCDDIDAFAKGIGGIIQEFHDCRSEGLTLGAVRIGSLLTRVLDLCRLHKVLLEPAMANVVLSTVVLEGVGRTLDPSMNLMDAALPFLLGRGL